MVAEESKKMDLLRKEGIAEITKRVHDVIDDESATIN